MFANVKAKYENGVLTPLEPLDLEEGVEVSVSVMVKKTALKPDPPKPDAAVEDGQGESEVDEYGVPWVIDGLKRGDGLPWIVARVKYRQKMAPPGAYDDFPKDSAMNYKHYLYGYPKEEEDED